MRKVSLHMMRRRMLSALLISGLIGQIVMWSYALLINTKAAREKSMVNQQVRSLVSVKKRLIKKKQHLQEDLDQEQLLLFQAERIARQELQYVQPSERLFLVCASDAVQKKHKILQNK